MSASKPYLSRLFYHDDFPDQLPLRNYVHHYFKYREYGVLIRILTITSYLRPPCGPPLHRSGKATPAMNLRCRFACQAQWCSQVFAQRLESCRSSPAQNHHAIRVKCYASLCVTKKPSQHSLRDLAAHRARDLFEYPHEVDFVISAHLVY